MSYCFHYTMFAVEPGLTTIFTMFSLALRPTHFLFGFHYNEMGTLLEHVVPIYTVLSSFHVLTELQRLRQSK